MADVAGDQQPALELLRAVLRRDEAAVRAAVAARCPLSFNGVTALHAAALADWGAIVPTLVAAGEQGMQCCMQEAWLSPQLPILHFCGGRGRAGRTHRPGPQ